MFDRICTKRAGSTSTTYGSAGSSMVSSIRAASMAARCALDGALHELGERASGRRCSTILPDVMRETSSRSSMSRTISATCRSIIARTRRTVSGASPDSRISSSPVRIGASGLRSSWASSARNSSLRASASRSCRSDSAIVWRARTWAEMSRK